MSFLEETCYHAVLTGILSDDLREKVLTQAMVGTVKNLPTLLEYTAAEEASKQKSPPRNVNAVRKSTNVPTRKCNGCGLNSHGPYNKRKSAECKAYGKKCTKCGKQNHFSTVCKSSTTAAISEANDNIDETDESALSAISGFITAVQTVPLTNPEAATPLASALRASLTSQVNTLPIPHHIYDEEMQKWVKKPPKSSLRS